MSVLSIVFRKIVSGKMKFCEKLLTGPRGIALIVSYHSSLNTFDFRIQNQSPENRLYRSDSVQRDKS